MPKSSFASRAPMQARSKESWMRALESGYEIVCEGGIGALSIAEVCKRSGVTPPSIYSRVDGKLGLFLAVYHFGIELVRQTEDQLLADLTQKTIKSSVSLDQISAAIATIFSRHRAFMRAVISYSSTDETFLKNGSLATREVLGKFADKSSLPEKDAFEFVQLVFSECVVRTMYGSAFYGAGPESEKQFRERLARLARVFEAAN